MLRLVDKEWGREISNALRADASELRIVCPFIKKGAIRRILEHSPSKIQVITRFSLADFAEGVSDIPALRELLDTGADIRGIKNLHAKIYLFGNSRAIITSANLTRAALGRNHEFGLVAEDESLIKACRDYFDNLWNRAGKNLTSKQLGKWDKEVTSHLHTRGRFSKAHGLKDFGANINIPISPIDRINRAKSFKIPPAVASASQAFVKFFGTGTTEGRVDLSRSVLDMVRDADCHRVLSYPTDYHPRQVNDGDVMFISRMTKNPNDHRIFGWAIATEHNDERDKATDEDIAQRSWRKQYGSHIRVDNEVFEVEFIDGTMKDGISLNEFTDTLWSDSFAPTQENILKGEGNTNPRNAMARKSHMRLSEDGFAWLTDKLQEAFAKHGKITASDIEESD